MIRPVTCICFLLATGSGLYLYQAKHAAQVLDRKIEKTVHDTEVVRDQTRAFRTEWTLLNEPDRLRQLAEQYLHGLRPIAPTQFTSLNDLNSRLPAIQMPAPAPEQIPVADADDPADTSAVAAATGEAGGTDQAEALPLPPPAPSAPPPPVVASAPAPAVARADSASSTAKVAEHRPLVPKPVIQAALVQPQGPRVPLPDPRPLDVRPVAMRPAELRQAEPPRTAESARIAEPVRVAEQPRQVEQPRSFDARLPAAAPRPIVQARTAPAPYSPGAPPAPTPVTPAGGSMLGMARGNAPVPAPLPLPRPIPVNAVSSQWPNGG